MQPSMQQRPGTDLKGESKQIFKLAPIDASIYVEKWTITVSNLWQIDRWGSTLSSILPLVRLHFDL